MRQVLLGLLLGGFANSLWAANNFIYDDISRRAGGSTFVESSLREPTAEIRIQSLSGRLELEDIQIFAESGFSANLQDLYRMDSRNTDVLNSNRFFNSDSYSGEPQSLVLYLPQTEMIQVMTVTIEAWADNAVARVELVDDGGTILPPDPAPIPPTPVDPDPEPIPAPICDVNAITDRILQCGDDLSHVRDDNLGLDRDILNLRDRLNQRNAELSSCLGTRDSLEGRVSTLESSVSRAVRELDEKRASNRQLRRQIHQLNSPTKKWTCWVQSRKGHRWEETGTNRAEMLESMVDKCREVMPHGRACGDRKWNPDRNGWGCRPIRGKDPDFDGDREDNKDAPGKDRGKRRKSKKKKDRDGRMGGN